MADCVGKRCALLRSNDGIGMRVREMENVCRARAVAAVKNEAGGGSAMCWWW